MTGAPTWYQLLTLLAPAQWLGGQQLGDELKLSRAAVWKQIEKLRAAGMPVEAHRGLGYRLPWPVRLLEPGSLMRTARANGFQLEIHAQLDSTSGYLSTLAMEDRHARAVVAEFQTAGRGRRDRNWLSPPACGLYFSAGWRLECSMMQLGALSLVVGLVTAQALKTAFDVDIALKWPNDLVCNQRKLGGCLVGITGQAEGPCTAVLGIGINSRMPDTFAPGQAWTDLWRLCGTDDRGRLIEALLTTLPAALRRLESDGFEAFAQAWTMYDALADAPVTVAMPDGACWPGIARGVSARGGLYVERAGHLRELVMGEVSVRGA